MLRIEDLHCKAGGRPVIRGITTDFAPGVLHVIVGPNGSGKSTFLKAFSGEWPIEAGAVWYDERPLAGLDKAELARRRAVMSQLPELHFPVRVDDIVMMGRYPHFAWRHGRHDEAVCRQAMERMGVLALAGRDYLTLSGGERQRVQFARALAQIWDPPAEGNRYLFLDEPVSSLDVHYQHEFLALARTLAASGIVLVAVLHDLNLALQYADRIVFLKEGRIVGAGAAPGIVTPAIVHEVFGMAAHLLSHPHGDRPVIVYSEQLMQAGMASDRTKVNVP
jgi:iron complex transport system ATP-binding protein